MTAGDQEKKSNTETLDTVKSSDYFSDNLLTTRTQRVKGAAST